MSTASLPQISTVVLSWNRVHLLKRCLRSYLQTVRVPFELIVVDNNSAGGARAFIKKVCAHNPGCTYLFLSKNEGGRALNRGLRRARGRLLHISENDLVYRPGWDQQVMEKFDSFPELGQLSLFSPFSPGNQRGRGGGAKGKGHKHYQSCICRNGGCIYITDRNVGASSVFRRELWDRGLRWKNIGSGGVKFPDDYAFSSAVRRSGYLAAWNDEYLVENLGHSAEEMKKHIYYYIRNYLAKKKGLTGLQRFLRKAGYSLIRGRGSQGGYKIVPFRREESG